MYDQNSWFFLNQTKVNTNVLFGDLGSEVGLIEMFHGMPTVMADRHGLYAIIAWCEWFKFVESFSIILGGTFLLGQVNIKELKNIQHITYT